MHYFLVYWTKKTFIASKADLLWIFFLINICISFVFSITKAIYLCNYSSSSWNLLFRGAIRLSTRLKLKSTIDMMWKRNKRVIKQPPKCTNLNVEPRNAIPCLIYFPFTVRTMLKRHHKDRLVKVKNNWFEGI